MSERMMQKRCSFCGQAMWTDHGDGTVSRHTSHGAECDRNRIAALTAENARLREAGERLDMAVKCMMDCYYSYVEGHDVAFIPDAGVTSEVTLARDEWAEALTPADAGKETQ